MTTSSSSVPILGPVLYFTSTDGYSYDVDNRPIYNLDTNIRHINTSLVGLGYGEHASLGGGALSPGRAVALSPNGSVFYPITSPSVDKPTENIVGLVIGVTDDGLNRVIWSSKHLDLDVLGLSSISSGVASGSYLVTSSTDLGVLSVETVPNLATQYVLGRIKSGSYIEVNTSTETLSNNVAAGIGLAVKDNHANLYGVTRLRNLLLLLDAGEAPIQYSKQTFRILDYYTANGVRNPFSSSLASDRSSISAMNSSDSSNYGSTLDDKILKERYTQFVITGTINDSVSVGGIESTWADRSYATSLPYSSSAENYELQPIGLSGTNYNEDVNLFKAFTIEKYYQYNRTGMGADGKLAAVATVFNPLTTEQGGEATKTIVWDFYSYSISTGLETFKHRVVLTGDAAEEAITDSSIFPTLLIEL